MKKPTMREIARALDTSAVTVSKALAGKPGMSDKLRKKIMKKAEEMGYSYPGGERPGARKSLDIGILIPDVFFQSDSYYSAMYRKLVQKLASLGHFGLLEILSLEDERNLVLPNLIQTGRVDGMVLLGQPGKTYYRMIGQQEIPAVFLDFYDEQGTADAVVGDNTYGAYRLTSHLIRNGHTRIGYVGNRRATSSIMDRFLGYYRAMMMNSLPVREEWILKDREEDGTLCDIQLPEELPTAFVCNCDVVARKLIERLQSRGLRVPEDVSVTGFDDYEIGPAQLPALSTFHVDMDAMVEEAVKSIVARCAGQSKVGGRLVVGGHPVYRDSDRPLG